MGGRTEVEDDGGGERALDGEAGLGLVLLHLLLGDLGGRDCGEVSSGCLAGNGLYSKGLTGAGGWVIAYILRTYWRFQRVSSGIVCGFFFFFG